MKRNRECGWPNAWLNEMRCFPTRLRVAIRDLQIMADTPGLL